MKIDDEVFEKLFDIVDYHHLRSGVPQTINNTRSWEEHMQVFRLIARRKTAHIRLPGIISQ